MAQRIGPEMFAEPADKTQAEIENEMALKAPMGIPIIGGGMAPGSFKNQGPDIMIQVTDTAQPNSREILPVSVAFSGGVVERRIPLGTPTLVPESLVKFLENDTVEVVKKRIDRDSAMWGRRDIAESQNPGMRYIEQDGDCYLVKTNQRYIVRRLRTDDLRV